MSDHSDPELLAGCLAGQTGDWAVLVERHGPALFRALRVRFRRPQEAEECLQEVWVHLLEDGGRRLRGIDPDRPLGPYLTSVALNLARRRRTEAHRPPPERSLPAPFPDPAEAMAQGERGDALNAALATLSPRDRLILLLAEVDGLPHARIAEAIGVAPQSVSALLGRALGRLGSRIRI